MKNISMYITVVCLIACNQIQKHNQTPPSKSIVSEDTKVSLLQSEKIRTLAYEEIPQDSSITTDYKIQIDDFDFYYDKNRILKHCDSIIRLNNVQREEYITIKRYVSDLSNEIVFYFRDFLLRTFQPKIKNRKTQEYAKSILIQYYIDFCGDKKSNFYIITSNNDTIKLNLPNYHSCDN